MRLEQRRESGNLIAGVSGRIDHANAEDFRAALAPVLDQCSPSGCKVILDLAALEYVSSAGLRVLMLAARRVKEQDGRLAVAALQPVVKEVFEITRFNLVLRVFDSVADAQADFAQAAT
jgi:anti-sigma B factor antagonist/stage II sporulation protein AA (anti-sigma F factor antagonist)